jgi:ribonuclease VapC
MFIDASALTAILTNEPDAAALLARLQTASLRLTSPLAIWETMVAVSRILDLQPLVANEAIEAFLKMAEIEVVPVSAKTGRLAVEAYDRYGRSRHQAALNFGDCFAYACARLAKVPLLYKGNDFPLTDIEAA